MMMFFGYLQVSLLVFLFLNFTFNYYVTPLQVFPQAFRLLSAMSSEVCWKLGKLG